MTDKLIKVLETRLNDNNLDFAELIYRFCDELSRRQINEILNEYSTD